MSKRTRPDRDRDAAQPPPADQQEAGVNASAAPSPVAGLLAGEATRGGEDMRRRGWFWHWNSVVTQYAPLIGLKGVGLLNSYTVWTDRREESPHRGYAFPSQQREADFYGEDRAELITINKILVALDLIEIRKEMVLRADGQGRRWRVPHNFYRVKDHHDGFSLNAEAVLRVVELADRDKAVYRYIRRLFSPRFAPIDPDNVWHRILPVLRQHEIWQRLAARAAHEDDRASARTRRGHAARKAFEVQRSTFEGEDDAEPRTSNAELVGDSATPAPTVNDSITGEIQEGEETSVATTNKGWQVDVAPANSGLTTESTTVVAATNSALPTAVAPANTTYHQDDLTTTTTVFEDQHDDLSQAVTGGSTELATGVTASVDHDTTGSAAGPGGRRPPVDVVGEAAAIRAFEDANGRRSTPAERQLLHGLAERFDAAARVAARAGLESGWAWLAAAVYEAVEAGSAYVAPRRLREILTRWEREGLPGAGSADERVPSTQGPPVGSGGDQATSLGEGPDLALPHGYGSRRTWEFAVGLLASVLDRERLAELVAGTSIAGYRDGEVTLAVPDSVQAERLVGEYRVLVERKLSEAMRRPVRLAVLTAEAARREGGKAAGRIEIAVPGDRESGESALVERSKMVMDDDDEEVVAPVFLVAECGMPSGQVWAAVLDEARRGGEISRANVDAWLRSTVLLGRGTDGTLIVGAPHTLAQKRVASRFLSALQAAVTAVIGAALPVEVVVARDWLSQDTAGRGAATPGVEHERKGA